MSRKKVTLLNILYTNFSRSRTETAKYLVKLYTCRKGSGIPVDGKDHRCFEILLAGQGDVYVKKGINQDYIKRIVL